VIDDRAGSERASDRRDGGHGASRDRGSFPAGDLPSSVLEPGTISEIRADSILVACGQGTLALTELQRPGRKPVAARDLINTLDLTGRRLG
jgi:methionyl-tRNA formyltransferase